MQNILPLFGILIYIATLVALSVINFFIGSKINTSKVPMQWGLNGDPTWYADKQIGLWFPVLIFLIVGGSLVYKARSSNSASWSDFGVLLFFCVLLAGVHYWHISKILAWSQKQL